MRATLEEREEWYKSPLFKVSEEVAEHFFVIDMDEERLLLTSRGEILVFSSRGQAERYARYEYSLKSFMVVDIDEKKWQLFQKEHPYILVEDIVVKGSE